MTASLADTAAVSGPAPPSTDALGTSVSIYFPMLAFALLLFEVLRRRKSWRILQPENTFGIQQARLQRWYSWIPLLFNVTDKEIVDKCGLDAWVILRFIRLGEKIAGVAVLASFLLFPLYVTSPLPAIQVLEQNASAPSSLLHPVEKRHIDSFDQLSIANVESGSWRLWFAILTAYAVSFGVMYLVRDEYAIYMKYRHDFLAHRDAPQYSVVVTDLPKRLRHPQPLLEYMNYLFPDSVHSVYVGVECRRLEELIEERQAVQYRLDGAIATLKGEAVLPRHNDRKVEPMTTKRPHITVERSCLGVCGRGKEVDAIEYYGGELERINREIEKQSLEIGVRQAYLDTQPQTQKKYGSIQQEKPLHRMLSLMKRLKVSSQKKEERGAKVKKGTSSQSTTVDSQSETSSLLRKELHVEDGDSRERAIEVAQQFLATLTGGSLTVAEIMRNAAFVSFRTLRAAHSAQQLLQTENPVKLRIHPAPHIKDVVWVNFGLPHRIKSTWGLLAAGLTFVIVCFWTIPTAFVTSLANVQKLRRTSPFWDDLIDIHPWVERSLEQLAPVLLSGMNILAGVIFGILATREGHLSLAEVNTSLFTKLCYFQVFQMFFVSAVTGSIITQMMALVDQPKRVLFFLGSSIASQSMLFITFIIVQVSMALPMVLLRVVPIMKDVFHRIFAPSYAQLPERRPWMGLYPLGYVSDIDPAYTLAQQYLIFLLVVVFAPIAPLLSYVGLLFFLCAEVVFRRHYFFVNESKWATVNSTGIFWPTLFNFIIGALFIAQCTLIGLLSLKGVGVLPFVVGATLPFCTLLFYWYVATLLCYPKASQNLPLDRCCDLDIARKNESTDFLKDVYKQPAMAQVEALQAQLEAPVLLRYKLLTGFGPGGGWTTPVHFLRQEANMEAVAAFVYASGGLVQVGEVKQFLHDDPEVERVFYEEVAPLKVLKKIITHHGEAHGLQWMDEDPEGRERGNFVVHVPTPQQLVTLVDVTRWVPRSLAALETHLNGLEMQRMKYGAASIFYQDYEPEWSFIRRRCGSVHNFVCRYDPLQSRFVSSPVEVRLVEAQTLAGTALTHGEEGDADDSDEVLTHLEDQSEVALGTEVVPDSPKLGQFELTATGGDGLEVGKKRITLKRWLRYKTMDALRAVQGVIRNVSSLTVHRPIISSWAIVRQSKGATTAKKRSLRARQETRSVPERPVWATTKSNEDGHEAIQTSNPSDSLVVEASSLDDEELEKPLKLGVMRLLIPEAGPNGCSSLEWKTKVRVIRTTHP